MDADLQARFDRLDSALTTLVDSIASYNSSPSAATSLVAADDHLTRGLDHLSSHQRNYQKIQSLRSIADSLDDRVKTTLLRLAEMRKDLLSINPHTEADILREVGHGPLLSYAQHISRFTVPPTHRPSLPSPIDEAAAPQQLASRLAVRAVTTPRSADVELAYGGAAPNNPARFTPNANSPRPPASFDASHLVSATEVEGKAMAALPPAVKAWLEPTAVNMPFLPWPEEDNIRSGALGLIEESWDKGLDPSQLDIAGDANHSN